MKTRMLGIALVLIIAALLCVPSGHAGTKPVVLFDEAHGQHFLAKQTGMLDLSKLAALFEEQGWDVQTSRAPITPATLAKVDAIVMSGAFAPLAAAEVEAVMQFLERGGRLCIMLHIAPPVDQLLHHLNVAISNGVIREREHILEGNPLNFRVTQLAPHPLMRNLEGFNIYGGWALQNLADNVQVIARTSPSAWIDLNGDGVLNGLDAVQPFGVVLAGHLGRGRFAVFGDDAMFQNQFVVDGNLALAKNLVAWLGSAAEQNVSAARWRLARR